jgi:hypothetical protein
MDAECATRGIPAHLHTGQRGKIEDFPNDERLFRRFRSGDDLVESLSFDRKSSSFCRSSLCHGADDALWKSEAPEGGRFAGAGVLSFSAKSFINRRWHTQDGATFEIEICHEPTRCNYAHSDFRMMRNGEACEKIKPSSVKQQIRKALRDARAVRLELDPA